MSNADNVKACRVRGSHAYGGGIPWGGQTAHGGNIIVRVKENNLTAHATDTNWDTDKFKIQGVIC